MTARQHTGSCLLLQRKFWKGWPQLQCKRGHGSISAVCSWHSKRHRRRWVVVVAAAAAVVVVVVVVVVVAAITNAK